MSFRATVCALKGMVCLLLLFLVAVFAAFDWTLLAIGLPMLVLGVLALTVHGYMTPQCTATVFRDPNGYVKRIVTEGQRVLYCTFWERPAEIIDTSIKSTEDRYNGFRTKDNVPMDMRVKLYFRLDPTLIREHERPQLVTLNDEAWKNLVRTVTCGTVITYIGQQRYRHIAPTEYRDALCARLSHEAAQALRGLGVIISPGFGVSIQDIQPTNAVLEAIVDRINAPLKGQAAVETLEPVTDQYGKDRALEAAIAATILNTGIVPSVIQEETDRSALPVMRPRKPAT
ncbi:MAG: SPFH domain-containing protein [Anaerolineae bacterium]|nr:SPFH domain-containing protein [Anaerolineae bacterium]